MTERPRHHSFPEPIAAYFAADKLDRDAVGRCFTKDAVVKDEGRTYHGPRCHQAMEDRNTSAKIHVHMRAVPL